MNVHMTIADAGLDGGHHRVAYHRVDQPRSPARNHDIDEAAGLDQMRDAGAVVARQQLHGVDIAILDRQRVPKCLHQSGIGPGRRRAAAKQHRVARLQRQPEGVDRDVRPALVDDADDTERHPLLAQLKAVGQRAATQHLTDRVRQTRDLTQPRGDAVDAVRVQREPVEHRLRRARRLGDRQILGVGRQDRPLVAEHVIGRGVQRRVLRIGAQRGQLARGDAGPPRGVVHLLAQVGDGWCLHTHWPSVSDLVGTLDSCQFAALRLSQNLRSNQGVLNVSAGLALTVMVARVCVVGSVNADLTFTVNALPRPGQTILASSLSSSPGGKGGNQAVAAARAGASVQLVAALGSDSAADQLRAHLRDNEVGLDGVVSLPGSSGSAVIIVDSAAENTIVVAPGANAHLTVTSADVRAVIADSDVVLLQLEIPIATAIAAAGVARAAGAVVMLNASPAGAAPHQLLALSELADVVVVNEAEAREWHWPVPHLVITRGARGASYLGDDERFDVPAPPVEAVDTTGAGDVFAGVLAAGWLAGHEDALRRACAAGALSTLVPGAGDCAPYAEAIDDAVINRRAGERQR